MMRALLIFWLLIFSSVFVNNARAAQYLANDVIALGTLKPNTASGQDLGDGTHRWDVFVSSLNTSLAEGASYINSSGNLAVDANVSPTELGYLDGVTSNIQDQLDAAASSTLNDGFIFVGDATNTAVGVNPSGDVDVNNAGVFAIQAGVIVDADVNASAAIARTKTANGTAYRLVVNDASGVMSENAAITASRALVSDANGQPIHATTTATEIGYVNGVTSAIQTQLDAKQARSTLTTKGDLYCATAASTVTRLGVGADTYQLVADSTQPCGIKWAAPPVVPSAASTTTDVAQTAHGFSVGDVLTFDGTDYVLAQADSALNAEVYGIVSDVIDANNFSLTTEGYISGLAGLTAATTYYLSETTPGLLTDVEPSTPGEISKPVLNTNSTSSGFVIQSRGALIEAPSTAGDVSGPASSVDGEIVLFDSTTGKLIKRATGTGPVKATSGVYSTGNINLASEVTGTLPNANTTATAANTASTIVLRDGSGNFAAGTITGTLVGNASTATALAANPTDCASDRYGTAIAANGDLTCAQVSLSAGVTGDLPFANIVQIANNRFLGNDSGGTADIEVLTGAEATALLSNFVGDSGSGGTKGLVPAPASGDAAASKFLKADGTWATPAGGGGGGFSAWTKTDGLLSYTGLGTVSKNTCMTRDEGDSVHYRCTVQAGTISGSGTDAVVTISGETIDTTKLVGINSSGGGMSDNDRVGIYTVATNSGTPTFMSNADRQMGVIRYNGTNTTLSLRCYGYGNGYYGDASNCFVATDRIYLDFIIPVN